MISIFLASTPLQVICCSEARRAYEIDEPVFIYLVKPDNKKTCRQIELLLDRLGWKSSERVWLGKKSYYFKAAYHINRISKSSINYLFIGNLGSPSQEVFYSCIEAAQKVFVDDGVATLTYYERYFRGCLLSSVVYRKKRLLQLVGVSKPEFKFDDLEFYSIFDLHSVSGLTVKNNDLSLFKEVFFKGVGVGDVREVVGYIGHPGRSIKDSERLKKNIKYILDRHPGSVVYYFMHRKERFEVVETVLKEYPVRILSPEWPIEVELASSGLNYVGFYSFISTALFTIHKLFPGIPVFQIEDLEHGLDDNVYQNIVQHLDGLGVERLHLT